MGQIIRKAVDRMGTWTAPDVTADDLTTWADRGADIGLTRRQIRTLRAAAKLMATLDPT